MKRIFLTVALAMGSLAAIAKQMIKVMKRENGY